MQSIQYTSKNKAKFATKYTLKYAAKNTAKYTTKLWLTSSFFSSQLNISLIFGLALAE